MYKRNKSNIHAHFCVCMPPDLLVVPEVWSKIDCLSLIVYAILKVVDLSKGYRPPSTSLCFNAYKED